MIRYLPWTGRNFDERRSFFKVSGLPVGYALHIDESHQKSNPVTDFIARCTACYGRSGGPRADGMVSAAKIFILVAEYFLHDCIVDSARREQLFGKGGGRKDYVGKKFVKRSSKEICLARLSTAKVPFWNYIQE